MTVPIEIESLSLAERFEALAADTFWVPDHVRVVARPEIVYTASGDDPDQLFNAVGWVRAGRAADSQRLVAEVAAAHAGHRSRWSVASHAMHPALGEALTAAGYTITARHEIRVLATNDPTVTDAPGAPGLVVRRVADRATLLDLYRVTDAGFDREPRVRPLDRVERELAQAAPVDGRISRFVAYDEASGTPISAGGLNISRELGVGFLWAGCTAPAWRRRGGYGELVRTRAAWARRCGIEHVGVFARVDTSAPLLERRGFAHLGTVDFWEADL